MCIQPEKAYKANIEDKKWEIDFSVADAKEIRHAYQNNKVITSLSHAIHTQKLKKKSKLIKGLHALQTPQIRTWVQFFATLN